MYFVECPSVICLNLFDVFLMVLGKTMMVSHGLGGKKPQPKCHSHSVRARV